MRLIGIDQAVWKDMIKSPIGIFQMESPYAFSLLKKFEPHSIFDMSLVTAAVRPVEIHIVMSLCSI